MSIAPSKDERSDAATSAIIVLMPPEKLNDDTVPEPLLVTKKNFLLLVNRIQQGATWPSVIEVPMIKSICTGVNLVFLS